MCFCVFSSYASYPYDVASSHRLLKSHLEREEFERKIKDLEDSLLVMKKQVPASDDNHSLAEVILIRHAAEHGDYTVGVGEVEGLVSAVLQYQFHGLVFYLSEQFNSCGVFVVFFKIEFSSCLSHFFLLYSGACCVLIKEQQTEERTNTLTVIKTSALIYVESYCVIVLDIL